MEKSVTAIAPDPLSAERYGGLTAGAWRWIGALALIALAIALPFLSATITCSS